MNEVLYGIVGAVAGGIVTFGGTYLKHWLDQRAANRLEYKQRQTLRWMLNNPRYRGRSLESLAGAMGETPERTKKLLILEGALPFKNGTVWSLTIPDEYGQI